MKTIRKQHIKIQVPVSARNADTFPTSFQLRDQEQINFWYLLWYHLEKQQMNDAENRGKITESVYYNDIWWLHGAPDFNSDSLDVFRIVKMSGITVA